MDVVILLVLCKIKIKTEIIFIKLVMEVLFAIMIFNIIKTGKYIMKFKIYIINFKKINQNYL